MNQNNKDLDQVVAIARKGAAAAVEEQMKILKQFAQIDCGTRLSTC